MKITIEMDSDEDRYLATLYGPELADAVNDIFSWLRHKIKHDDLSDEKVEALEWVTENILNIITVDHDIPFTVIERE